MNMSNWLDQIVDEESVHRHFVSEWQLKINKLISKYVFDGKTSTVKRKFWHFADAKLRALKEMPNRNTVDGPTREGVFLIPLSRGDIRAIDDAVDIMESKVQDMNIPKGEVIMAGEFENLFWKTVGEESDKINSLTTGITPTPETPIVSSEQSPEILASGNHTVIKVTTPTGRRHVVLSRKASNLNLSAGKALHGTLVKLGSSDLGIIIGGKNLICRDMLGKKVFTKYASFACAMISGEHMGKVGKLSPLMTGMELSSDKTIDDWKLNPNEIGKYRDIASIIAESVPQMVYGVGRAEILDEKSKGVAPVQKDGHIVISHGMSFAEEFVFTLLDIFGRTSHHEMTVGIREWINDNVEADTGSEPDEGAVPCETSRVDESKTEVQKADDCKTNPCEMKQSESIVKVEAPKAEVPKAETPKADVIKDDPRDKELELERLKIRNLELQVQLKSLESIPVQEKRGFFSRIFNW